MPDNIDVQNSLIERLLDAGVPNVWEGTVPAGIELPKQNGVYLPYAVVTFGGHSPVAQAMQGITSSADDLKWTSVAVEVVAPTPAMARQVEEIVRAQFEGYIPDPRWGQLREQLSDSYTVKVPDFELWPVRFVRASVYNTQLNA